MKERRILLLVVLMVMMMLYCEVEIASATLSAAECKEERRLGINACKPVLSGKLPTAECCLRVRVSHVECVCPVVTPKLAALIDLINLNRAIRLIEGCGRRVPRHFKCGSITTP